MYTYINIYIYIYIIHMCTYILILAVSVMFCIGRMRGHLVGDMVRRPQQRNARSTSALFEVQGGGGIGEILSWACAKIRGQNTFMARVRIFENCEPATYGRGTIRAIDTDRYETCWVGPRRIGRVLCKAQHPNCGLRADVSPTVRAVLRTKYK